jgi:hypothetical protein
LASLQKQVNDESVIMVEFQGKTYRALLDSGAQENFMAPTTVKKLGLREHKKTNSYRLKSADGNLLLYNEGRVEEETDHLPIRVHNRLTSTKFDITDIGQWEMILGIPWLREFNPQIDWTTGHVQWKDAAPLHATRNSGTRHLRQATLATAERRLSNIENVSRQQLSKELQQRLKDIPDEYLIYEKLFREELETGLPEHTHYDHEIILKEGTHPKFQKIYPLKHEHRDTLKDYIQDNLKKGFIRPSQSPAGCPILFVPKKNGKWRLCVDYRSLNDITIKNCYPLPLISELRDLLVGAQWFTALDLKGAYNLIRIKEGHEWKTAFRTREGHFEYLVMPFGLTNAPATFQTMINEVLRDFVDIFVVVYLDDILIFSKTLEQHKEHVHKVLQRLLDNKLLVEPEKTAFHVQQVDFLGYRIRPNEIAMDPKKVATVKDWPVPRDVRDVRAFLGFVNFYRRFMQGYGKMSTPLTDLTRATKIFDWTDQCQKAFEEIRDNMLKEPILSMPDSELPWIVETDASDYALGATASQMHADGRLHPVAYFSKKLHGPELNYQIHDKELMAIIEAFKEWRVYLSGTKEPVKVYTDHKNLVSFTTTKDLNKRQIRWAEFMTGFNFQIIYRPGTKNGRADALSRRSDLESTEEVASHALLRYNEEGNLVPNIRTLANLSMVQDTRKQEILDIHSAPAHGHQGVWKTFQRLRQHHDKSYTRQEVADAIAKCDLCKKSKATRHKPYGLLQPLPVATGPWKSVSMDFIVDLPLSREPLTDKSYDAILVIVDRFTKYAYFLPYLKTGTAEDTAYVFLRNVAAQHGMPDELISDRDKLFTSHFWDSLTAQLGPKLRLSTAFHPESDGQTERTNQTLEQYLRCYINYPQNNWVEYLPIAQFAYNSAPSESSKVSPFYANYGYQPTAYGETREAKNAPKATKMAEQIKEIHEQLRTDLESVRQRMTHYANQKRMKGPSFKEGDHVYLLRKNIKTKRPNAKLDFKKLGPFRISKVVSQVNYELALPKNMQVHNIFHVALLEEAPRSVPLETSCEAEDTEEFEVERILDHRMNQGKDEYLVRWKNCGPEENTWEPIQHLANSPQKLRQYHTTKSQNQVRDFIDHVRSNDEANDAIRKSRGLSPCPYSMARPTEHQDSPSPSQTSPLRRTHPMRLRL